MIKFIKEFFAGTRNNAEIPIVKRNTHCRDCAFFTGFECDNGPKAGDAKNAGSEGCEFHYKMADV